MVNTIGIVCSGLSIRIVTRMFIMVDRMRAISESSRVIRIVDPRDIGSIRTSSEPARAAKQELERRARTGHVWSVLVPRRDRAIDRAQPALSAFSKTANHARATESSHRTAACTSACSQPRPPYVPVLDIFPVVESPPRKPRCLKSTVTIPRLGSGELIRMQFASRQPISDSGSCFQPFGMLNVFT